MFYLMFLAFALCAAYCGLFFLFPVFFGQPIARLPRRSLSSMALVLLLYALVLLVMIATPNVALGNRIIHMFGGGFLAFLVCVLAARDAGVAPGKFQFFVFSVLLVTALGVGNEIAEFVLQNYVLKAHLFANSINDTWLDLVSNTLGALVAGALFVPFAGPGRSMSRQTRSVADAAPSTGS